MRLIFWEDSEETPVDFQGILGKDIGKNFKEYWGDFLKLLSGREI